ncbi:hypothetical protein LP420_39645 [Massilia sp. B-10]|nr:hypothetical protein LP420_39645 [Massilia sp. B-10]
MSGNAGARALPEKNTDYFCFLEVMLQKLHVLYMKHQGLHCAPVVSVQSGSKTSINLLGNNTMASDQPGFTLKKLDASTIASYLFVAAFLLLVLLKGLLGALFMPSCSCIP